MIDAPATTVGDLIRGALVDCGAFGTGMAPPADAVNKGLQRLNWMLSTWSRKRWMVYHLLDSKLVSDGSQFYTAGPGGQFDLPSRPDKLEAAYMVQLANTGQPVSYRLRVIAAMEDYASVTLKELHSWTNAVFYDAAVPLGKVFPIPVMQQGYELHILTKQQLLRYGELDMPVGLPEEYEAAIYYNLIVRLGANYRIAANPVDVAMAKDGMNVIRGSYNAVATMRMPNGVRRTGGRYNIFSDNN